MLRLCSGWLGWRGHFSFPRLVKAPGLMVTWQHASLSISVLSTRRNCSTCIEWTSCSSTTPRQSTSGLDEGQDKTELTSLPWLFDSWDDFCIHIAFRLSVCDRFALFGCHGQFSSLPGAVLHKYRLVTVTLQQKQMRRLDVLVPVN